MPDTRTSGSLDLVPTLVGFARRLRDAGVPLGTGDVLTYCAAVEPLDPGDLVDLYWAGRATLVTRHDQIPVYDRVFRTYFLNNRGDEQMGGTWNYLDITPLGRQEVWEDSPEGYPQTPTYKWWNWHDSYVADAAPDRKWVEVSTAGEAAMRNQNAGARP